MAETLVPESIPAAREALEQIRKRNPQAVVLYEIYFFEADTNAYPPDSPWWFRDKDGHKVQFWKGCYNMDVSNPEYIGHIARRIEAVYRALDGKAGVFLDNLRYDRQAKAGWTLLLRQVRARCGDIPILVNAGWDSDDLRWVAPWINGILYEDSVAHTEDGDTEKFYARIHADWLHLREPRIGLNEKFGKAGEAEKMRRDLIRTLVYTDMFFLYADSTYGHRHVWWPEWDAPLGEAQQPPATPAPGALARREFAGGTVFWLPATATEPVQVALNAPMVPVGAQKAITEITLKPDSGVILLRAKTVSRPPAAVATRP
jgi:hypothetical protein